MRKPHLSYVMGALDEQCWAVTSRTLLFAQSRRPMTKQVLNGYTIDHQMTTLQEAC